LIRPQKGAKVTKNKIGHAIKSRGYKQEKFVLAFFMRSLALGQERRLNGI